MEYQLNGLNGGGISFSNSLSSVSSIDPTTISGTNNNYSPSSSISTSQNHNHRNNSHRSNGTNNNNEDPMHSWWESVSKARARIHSLISILFPDHIHHRNSISSHDIIDGDNFENDVSLLKSNLSSLADSDRPARSLLESFDAYSAISASLSSPHSGSGDDILCQWLYDTFQSSDPDLRLVVLSFVPLVAGLYLSRVHSCSPVDSDALSPSLAGFEAVLLALYASETRARGGKPVVVSIPDLSQPSLYHNPTPNSSHRTTAGKPSSPTTTNAPQFPSVGVVSPPLEPQVAVKSTKRGAIVGVAFDSYYKHISFMPSWSKIELCQFAAAWAGADCSCSNSLDHPNLVRHEFYGDEYIESDEQASCSLDTNVLAGTKNDVADHIDSSTKAVRIPLPWELLQPILRILGHCLLGPLNSQNIKDAAGVAVRHLYARASHDLFPQAILATRSLIQLDNRARATAEAAAIANASSTANTPNSKTKKPEVLLVSK